MVVKSIYTVALVVSLLMVGHAQVLRSPGDPDSLSSAQAAETPISSVERSSPGQAATINSSAVVFTTLSGASNVSWSELAGVSISGNVVTKTAATGWGNSGAASLNLLPSGTAGYIEITCDGTAGSKLIGLSDVNLDHTLATIDYGVLVEPTQAVVYLNGSPGLAFPTIPGDVIKIDRSGSSIAFKKNDVVMTSFTGAFTGAMVIDVSLHDVGVAIGDVYASFGPRTLFNAAWTQMQSVTTDAAGNLTKSAGGNAWNAGAFSLNRLPASTDGWIEYKLDVLNGQKAIGLSETNVDVQPGTIKYALNINGGSVSVQQSGTVLNTISAVVGDIFRLERIGSTIYVKQNGVVVQTISGAVTTNVYVDASLYTANVHVDGVKSSFWIPSTEGAVPDEWEFRALKDIYDSTGGAGWTKKSKWPAAGAWPATPVGSAVFGTWDGVTVQNGDVVGFSKVVANMTGKLPSSIGKLSQLRNLDIRQNKIGGKLPASITSLVNLTHLGIYDNLFSGNIPSDIGNLKQLQILRLSQCKFTGTIPESIGELSNLTWVSFYENFDLGGPMPEGIYNLTNLTDLYIYDTKVEWQISDQIANLNKLIHLWAYRNNISGPLPAALGNVTTLKNLYIYTTPVEGELPENWRHLVNLENVWLHETKISGQMPAWISEWQKLKVLSIGATKMAGPIPPEFGTMSQLTGLYMQQMELTGEIPGQLGNLTKLNYLDLKETHLQGALPLGVMTRSTLKTYSLNNCNFNSLPNISGRTDKSTVTINIANNAIPIPDIERYFTAANVHPFKSFVFAPQRSSAPALSDLIVSVGGQLKFSAPSGGVHGVYTWEKLVNGTWTSVGASNESVTPNEFLLNNSTEAHSGSYRYRVTNTWLPGIQLESGVINVRVGSPISFAVDDFAFRYRYDAKHRMSHKKVPGADWVYMVYDDRNRLVLTQDGNQRGKQEKEWTFTKYDALDRAVLTGIYKSENDQADMQAAVDDFYAGDSPSADKWHETATQPSVHGYSNRSFPNVSSESDYLSVVYYDNYGFLGALGALPTLNFESSEISAEGTYPGQVTAAFGLVVGQTTGGKIKNLENNNWMWSAKYFDDHGRVIQSVGHNHKGGVDRTTNVYDFVGKIIVTKTSHSVNDQSATAVTRQFVYDHAGRLVKTWHQVGSTRVLLAQNVYNELGQLTSKKLHSTGPEATPDNERSFKEVVSYHSNIRGWLDKINDPETNSGLFNMALKYETPSQNGGPAQFNGNISEVVWQSADSEMRSYGYYYDSLNRLKEARYFDHAEPTRNNRFNETVGGVGQRGYDLNGNILRMKRTGLLAEGFYGDMDHLTYGYSGNQLVHVNDNVQTSVAQEGFKELAQTSNEYSYDVNGNMTSDKNKGITAIEYNYLNLPRLVRKSASDYIVYCYNSSGTKLSQQVFGANPKSTDYIGEFIYENDALQFINHEEGRVVMIDGSPEYQYHLKDHLGNVRVTFTSRENVVTSMATMETAKASNESSQFGKYDEVHTVNSALFDHTHDKSSQYSVRLNGSEHERVGLVKTISVMPGDTIRMEVFGKYVDPVRSNWSAALSTIVSSIAAPALSGGLSVDGLAQAANNVTTIPPGGLLAKDNSSGKGPKAYLNYVVFDRDYNLIEKKSGYKRMSEKARERGKTLKKGKEVTGVPHERLNHELVITEPGYVYIYLSNEEKTPVEVFFDDFSVTQIKSGVVQMDDYYPFGLTFNSFQRESSVGQRYKFQGQEHIDDLNLGWDSFKWRNHQPDIGRFFNVDPISEKYVYNSPYAFAENRVASGRELEGLEWAPPLKTGENGELVIDGDAATAQHTAHSVEELKIIGGFTPAGVIVDVIDLGEAIFSGSRSDILMAGVGFLPGGDFLKGGKKIANAVDNVSDVTKKVHKNANDATGHFVLYKVDDPDDGILKIGKADADRVNATGDPVRMKASERKAQKAGYPNAKAEIIEDLGVKTTGEAKLDEAARVKAERAKGNALPLNKEKDKRYKKD